VQQGLVTSIGGPAGNVVSLANERQLRAGLQNVPHDPFILFRLDAAG
jgi:hypothetical protein